MANQKCNLSFVRSTLQFNLTSAIKWETNNQVSRCLKKWSGKIFTLLLTSFSFANISRAKPSAWPRFVPKTDMKTALDIKKLSSVKQLTTINVTISRIIMKIKEASKQTAIL